MRFRLDLEMLLLRLKLLCMLDCFPNKSRQDMALRLDKRLGLDELVLAPWFAVSKVGRGRAAAKTAAAEGPLLWILLLLLSVTLSSFMTSIMRFRRDRDMFKD